MAVAGLLTEMEDRLDIVIDEDEIDGELFETYGNLLNFAVAKHEEGVTFGLNEPPVAMIREMIRFVRRNGVSETTIHGAVAWASGGRVYAHSHARGQSSPPNTSESRHSTLIDSCCGWWRFSAIFSGSTCTIQKSAMAPRGTTRITNQEMAFAMASSASPEVLEA